MPCSRITASSVPRRPSRPPWIFGCSVFTRPSMISGNPVTAETSVTSMPLPRNRLAVPPVERIATPRSRSARAKSSRPSLFETLSSARRTGVVTISDPRWRRRPAGSSAGYPVDLQLLAQGAAIDAEDVRGATLVAGRVVEHRAEQRLLDLAHHQVVQVAWCMAVETREVRVQGLLGE